MVSFAVTATKSKLYPLRGTTDGLSFACPSEQLSNGIGSDYLFLLILHFSSWEIFCMSNHPQKIHKKSRAYKRQWWRKEERFGSGTILITSFIFRVNGRMRNTKMTNQRKLTEVTKRERVSVNRIQTIVGSNFSLLNFAWLRKG